MGAKIQWEDVNPGVLQYVLQIKQRQGEFVQFAQEINKRAGEQQQYKTTKQKPTFLPEYKVLW